MQRNRAAPKTATLPSLRVDPRLRQAAEDVLEENESLSTFIEESVRRRVAQRQAQRDFIARGLASRDRARDEGRYVPAHEVLQALGERLERKRPK
ncbi:MAG TPA: YlcI/YnfO family protein [Luteimonas sp.]|nr:YlcI/YnfO family protein [Luteimonas sp.]